MNVEVLCLLLCLYPAPRQVESDPVGKWTVVFDNASVDFELNRNGSIEFARSFVSQGWEMDDSKKDPAMRLWFYEISPSHRYHVEVNLRTGEAECTHYKSDEFQWKAPIRMVPKISRRSTR